MENILIFDTETTGLPPKGANYETDFESFPHIVQLAWFMNGESNNFIIKPEGYVIPDDVVAIHGITTQIANEKGTPFRLVIAKFIGDCLVANKIVAHNVYFDTSIIKANVLRMFGKRQFYSENVEPALDKSKRIDTMMKTIKFVQAPFASGRPGFKYPTLEELYFKLFNESFPAHNAIEDVMAIKRSLEELIKLGIIEI
jgi:DNA polymerase III epsilon subunit-like protein